MLLRTATLMCGCWSLLAGSPVLAVDEAVPVLSPVRVYDTLDVTAGGVSIVPRDIIQSFPSGNGSVNELLRVLPDVQVSEQFRSSSQGGEIQPPEISISGGKVYQNYYSIDGIGNNSQLDPTAKSTRDINDVPGHVQEFFIDTSLVEEIEVYDANVPARYGGFTGGLVNVRTRHPGSEFAGRVQASGTRDSWTRFHLSDEDYFDFAASGSDSRQPKFEKIKGGVTFDLPLDETQSLLVDYHQLYSKIPLVLLAEEEAQNRRNQNLFLKYAWDIDSDNLFDATLLYAPYEAQLFLQNVRDSKYEIEGGGYSIGLQTQHFWTGGDLSLKANWRQSENSRQAAADLFSWAATDTKPWGRLVGSTSSNEGGLGQIEKRQDTVELKADSTLTLPATAAVGHTIGLGGQYTWRRGSFERPLTNYIYQQVKVTPDVVCGAETATCVDGEQFFTGRRVFSATSLEEVIHQVAGYLDDRIEWGDLELRPGLRAEYDDYLKNVDVAPRVAANYDLFGDDRTLLTAGFNRYFGRSLLAFKLREAQQPVRTEYRTTVANIVQPWQTDPLGLVNQSRFSDLETPYTDEYMLGVDQVLASGTLSAKYVRRRGRNEFARSYGPVEADGLRYYTFNNSGRSEHESLRVSWERRWRDHYLLLSWTWQDSFSGIDDYDTALDDEDLGSRVWFQGEIVYRSELPRADFNRSQLGRLLYIARLPLGFSFTNFTEFLGGFSAPQNTFTELAIPGAQQRRDVLTGETIVESLPVYEIVRYPAEIVFDWKLEWTKDVSSDSRFSTFVEIFNVFDRKVEAANHPGEYRIGRQFWAGVQFNF